MKHTTIPGVWAVGDVTGRRPNMATAIADGVVAAADCNMALLDQTWNNAA
jgi:thioredoxin reductase